VINIVAHVGKKYIIIDINEIKNKNKKKMFLNVSA